MENSENQLVDNEKNETTVSQNTEAFLQPIEAEKKVTELKQDFKQFMEQLPRKHKRKYFEHRKFSNVLEVKMRAKRLEAIKNKK